MTRSTAIPESKAEVSKKWLKSPNLDVDKARQDMINAREEATTFGGGTKIPKFIDEDIQRHGIVVPVSEDTVKAIAANARVKLARAGAKPGTRIDLNKAREMGVITQEEVDALLGKKIEVAATVPVEPAVVEEETVVAAAPAAVSERVPAAPTPAPVPVPRPESSETVPDTPTRKTRQEDKDFVVEMYKNGGNWIGDLTFKNGAGSERFIAANKDELIMKLLVGKANATQKVRNTVKEMKRRLLCGTKYDTWDFFWQEAFKSHGMTKEKYDALPSETQDFFQDNVQAQQILAFTNSTPEYWATEDNFKIIAEYLNNHSVPLTLRNLEIAYNDLTEDDLLELRPKPAESAPAPASIAPPALASTSSVPTVATVVEDSTAADVPVAPVVPTTSAPAPNATVVRKKVSTGLVPGSSSAAPSGTAAMPTEESTAPKELSVTELKKLSDAELKRIATQGRKYGRIY